MFKIRSGIGCTLSILLKFPSLGAQCLHSKRKDDDVAKAWGRRGAVKAGNRMCLVGDLQYVNWSVRLRTQIISRLYGLKADAGSDIFRAIIYIQLRRTNSSFFNLECL
ncbi:hypothetical protein F5051DRAFT_162934 [Lentinula edodes]|nr:hypothetical protein F5051DRAFT_162934 [Lentinula edodes]